MSALQLRWINYHFAHGNISREEFATLRKRVSQSEDTQTSGVESQRKVLRLHPQTRRVLAQIRIYRSVSNIAGYLLIVMMISAGYIVVDHYKNTGTISDLNLAVFEQYFTRNLQEPLPSDLKLAADYLMTDLNWSEEHVQQFINQWQALDQPTRKKYQSETWLRSFSLALSLKIAEQGALIKNGEKSALQRRLILEKLADHIEAKVA